MTYFFLSEATVVRALWNALRRRSCIVVGCEARFKPLEPLVRRLHAALERRGCLLRVDDIVPGLDYRVRKHLPHREGHYRRHGIDIEARFECADPARIAVDYLRPYRHQTGKYVRSHMETVYRLDMLDRHVEQGNGADVPVFGVPAEIVDLHRIVFGQPRRLRFVAPVRQSLALNLLSAFVIVGYTAFGIVRRTRAVAPSTEIVPLGVDYTDGSNDPRTNRVVRELVDDLSQVLMVFRSDYQFRRLKEDLSGFRMEVPGRLRVTPREASGLLALLVGDAVRLWPHFRRLGAVHFWEVFSFVRMRVEARLLFCRYRFRHFLARDDYNVEHIIRTQEVRRSGGRSLGIAHALHSWGMADPTIRYIDFDHYFVFGAAIADRYYRDFWPKRMTTSAIGSIGMSREQLRILERPRPPNIVVFYDTDFDWPDSAEIAIDLARAFPDRVVFVKPKPNRETGLDYATIKTRIEAAGLPNLEWTGRNSYELMLESCYAVSGLSTVGAEALQFGLVTFIQNLPPKPDEAYYEDFPGLCIDDSGKMIRRIRAIESGDWQYPYTDFAGVVDLSGRVVYDVLRAEIGLRPKEPGRRFVPYRIGVATERNGAHTKASAASMQ